MVETDIDVLESRACCVQLAVQLTTHCGSYQWLSFVTIEGIPLTLPPLDPSSKWLSLVALICSNRGNSSHATTTGSRFGIDLEVVFLIDLQWLSLIAIEGTLLTLPPLGSRQALIWM